MKCVPDQLKKQLTKLAPVYLVSGDEPLLVQEARDAIYQAAKKAGYTLEKHHLGQDFSWPQLTHSAQSLSLFSQKTLIELRLNTVKLGKAGGAELLQYLEKCPQDKILMLITPKLDAATQKTKWAKAIDKVGVIVQAWPIDRGALPVWIQQRMQEAEIQTDRAGLQMMVEQTEGNLLATHQEIEKLRLLYGPGKLTTEQIGQSIGDNARFDVFKLVDAALGGDANRVARIMGTLQESGAEPMIVLWALTREARQLIAIQAQLQQGKRLNEALRTLRIWDKRLPIYQQALRQHNKESLHRMLRDAQVLDATIKGISPGNTWSALLDLALHLAGKKLPLQEDVT